MSRVSEIAYLQARYRRLARERKWLSANMVLVRLRELIRKQINAEIRQDKRENVA